MLISQKLLFNLINLRCPCRCFRTSCKTEFWEADEKGGYREKKELTLREEVDHIKAGLTMLKGEVNQWKNEWVEKFTEYPPIIVPGSSDILWKFDNPQILQKWIVTSDKDNNEGFSECQLILNKNKKALFYGTLSTKVPKDGKIKRSGYCNMRCIRPQRSFKRNSCYDWSMYTHLLMNVRGDGRSYLITLGSAGLYDVMWNDVYSFVLYTRGGPYWQLSKIPFSRFFLSSKGRVQDKQAPIPVNNITSVGISCGDRIPGPFSLEIDFIGIQHDPSHTEEFAYEMYDVPKFIVGT